MIYEKWAKRKRLKWTLKSADIRSWGSLTPPLTARKSNALTVSPTAKNSGTVRVLPSKSQHCSIAFVCHQGHVALRWLVVLPLAWNLGTVRAFGLQIQNCLLTEKDEQLPFGWHVVSIFEHFYFVQHLVFIMLVWPQEVVVGNPEC